MSDDGTPYLFQPGSAWRTPEQECTRTAARLLVLTRQIGLSIKRSAGRAERNAALVLGLEKVRRITSMDLRRRPAATSAAVTPLLGRVAERLLEFYQAVDMSSDIYHLLRLARAEVLTCMGRSGEALAELERQAVFLSVQSPDLRYQVAIQYFDLCTAAGRFADGAGPLLHLIGRSRRGAHQNFDDLRRQCATMVRRPPALGSEGMYGLPVRWRCGRGQSRTCPDGEAGPEQPGFSSHASCAGSGGGRQVGGLAQDHRA